MPNQSMSLDRILNLLVATAALAVAVAVVHREFVRVDPPDDTVDEAVAVSRLDGWEDLARHGLSLGMQEAPIRIFVFADVECPFCKQFHETVQSIERAFPTQTQLVFLHFPLSGHRFARIGARAIECADVMHKPRAMIDRLYERQDSLGLKSWASFASEAGIADTVAFQKCLVGNDPLSRIDSARAAGLALKVNGTPTVIVNGWRYATPPSEQELFKLIDQMLAPGSEDLQRRH